ncbi:hypothetical protein [Nonomuraea dietziae]|uniref:hypothetical protein n=1 Tax=Nonomuraea dietziae TaxID=65515 RepID=UPI0033D52B33
MIFWWWEIGTEVVGDDVGDSGGVAGAVDLDHADAQAPGGADGIVGDEAVSFEPVALSPAGVADIVSEGGGPGEGAELPVAEFFGGHHDDHLPGRAGDGYDQLGALVRLPMLIARR